MQSQVFLKKNKKIKKFEDVEIWKLIERYYASEVNIWSRDLLPYAPQE